MNKGRVLVVDDEEDLRDVLTYQLKAIGAAIETAENGQVALEMAKTGRFDAILTDINMPVMTGLEFLEKLREAGFDTPCVFLTGFGDKAKAVEALRLGAFDFVEKPWDAERLRAIVRGAFEHGLTLKKIDTVIDHVLEHTDGSAEAEDAKTNLRRIQKSLLLMRVHNRRVSNGGGGGGRKTG